MRHEPSGIHGVARETAAELIVNSASIHAVASVQDHLRGRVVVKAFRIAQHERWNARLRKFWRAAETAVNGIERFLEHFHRAFEQFRRERKISFHFAGGDEFKARVQFIGGRNDLHFPFAPEAGDLFQQL